jgi:hypothetical protein
MAFFTQIDPTNTRRFVGPEDQVLAIYDQARAYTLYVSQPRSYFADEVREIDAGGRF